MQRVANASVDMKEIIFTQALVFGNSLEFFWMNDQGVFRVEIVGWKSEA